MVLFLYKREVSSYAKLIKRKTGGSGMETTINKIFEYFDEEFFEERVEIDEWGNYGAHYQGLALDCYLDNSVLGIDYLSIEDYFETVAGVSYCETDSLFAQYSKESLDIRLKVIGAILTLVKVSTYHKSSNDKIISKATSFLNRYGLEIEEKSGILQIKNDYKISSGSYCDIYVFNDQILKKQLKDIYRAEPDWKKRFRYEYENMLKLSQSAYVLKVFSYSENEDSYLMEKCDCNIYEYLNGNPFVTDKLLLEVIHEILLGMKDVHDSGIIHRDLHLGNILVKDGHIILSDFGLSKDTMINHSLKSTSTPKNSHYFMDPVGFTSFTSLDKLSDIYSIGKIIDYITSGTELNQKLSYIIAKATHRDRKKRYQTLDDLIQDIDSSTKDIAEEEKNRAIFEKIRKAEITPDVEKFLLDLIQKDELSYYIVNNQLYNFGQLLLTLQEMDQVAALEELNRNYASATGYGHFENYDLFASIANYIICNSKELRVQKYAYTLLEGCSNYRYRAADFLREINMRYPMLGKQNS